MVEAAGHHRGYSDAPRGRVCGTADATPAGEEAVPIADGDLYSGSYGILALVLVAA